MQTSMCQNIMCKIYLNLQNTGVLPAKASRVQIPKMKSDILFSRPFTNSSIEFLFICCPKNPFPTKLSISLWLETNPEIYIKQLERLQT